MKQQQIDNMSMTAGLPVSQSGFTLIELMVVVILIIGFTTMAVPNFQEAFARNSIRADAQRIQTMLNLARVGATATGSNVSIATLNTPAPGFGFDWSAGWIAYNDVAPLADTQRVPAVPPALPYILGPGDTVLDAPNAVGQGANFRYTTTSTVPAVSFLNNGRLDVVTTGVNQVFFDVCDTQAGNDGIPGIRLTLNAVGRITWTTPSPACP